MFKEDPQSEFVDITSFIENNRESIEPLMYFYETRLKEAPKEDYEEEDELIEQACLMTTMHVLCNSCDPKDFDRGLIGMPEEGINDRLVEWMNMMLVYHSIWKLERLDLIEPSSDDNGYRVTKNASMIP